MGPSEIEKMKREKNSITKQMMQLQHKKVDATQVASKKIITSSRICSFIESKCDAKKRNTHFRKCFHDLRTQTIMKFYFMKKNRLNGILPFSI